MLCGYLILGLVTAAPGDIVLVRQLQTTPERARDVVDRVYRAVTARGVALRQPAETRARLAELAVNPETCGARRACLTKMLQGLGGSLLITIDVGHIADEMAIGVDAFTAEGQAVAERRFTLNSAGYPAGFEADVRVFADALQPFASTPVDAPLVQAPPPPPPPPLLNPQGVGDAWRPRTTAAFVSGGAALATAAAAISLSILGVNARTQLEASNFTTAAGLASRLTEPQARTLADAANTDFSLSLGLGLATAALSGVLLWALLAPSQAAP